MEYVVVGIIIALAWIYDFYNGANDSANAIATTVSSRVLSPLKAVILAAVFNVLGALLTTKVAETIGKGILSSEYMTTMVVASTIIGAIAWAAFATHAGIPVSITHCMVGGIIGAGLAAYGLQAVNFAKLNKVIIGMLTSPVLGFLLGLFLLIAIFWMFKNRRPATVQHIFGRLQLLSASFMAYTHGTNDTQNAMGIITANLLAGGFIGEFKVPLWVILGSALFMGLGTFYGGRKVIHTMGSKLTEIKPVHGFAAETSSSLVILGASFLGIPISTTHVISASIMGVGSAKRFSAVRWGIVGDIIVAWFLTIPATAFVAAITYYVFDFIF